MRAETLEDLLERLEAEDAPDAFVGDAALDYHRFLIGEESPHLACWNACRYEDRWDDGRKLDVIADMADAGMLAQAILLCHRWKLSALCDEKKPDIYRILFPRLQPRTERKGARR